MLGPTLTFARCNVLGLAVVAVIAVPPSDAFADGSVTAAKSTRICVSAKTGLLRSVKTPGRCRTGERSFFVSRRGVQGVRGVAGQAGASGRAGASGAIGEPGATGATGIAGATGTTGTQGVVA